MKNTSLKDEDLLKGGRKKISIARLGMKTGDFRPRSRAQES